MGRILLGICFLIACSCSLKETAEDIRDTSKDIKRQSEKIDTNSQHLARRADDLALKESTEAFEKNITNLFGESDRYERRNVEPDMVFFAESAVKALLFQMWKGNVYGASLDRYFELAVDSFFIRLTKHIPRDFVVDTRSYTNPINWIPSRSYKGVASLGARLSEVRPEYVEIVGRSDQPVLSLYDLIVLALQNRDAMMRTENLPLSVAKVLQWKQEAIYLLQLRHNYLPMLVLSRMSKFQDMNWGELSRLSFMYNKQEVNIRTMDPEQLKLWIKWLNEALETRRALAEMNIEPEYNRIFLKILSNIEFGQQDILSMSANHPDPRLRLEREFAESFMNILKAAE